MSAELTAETSAPLRVLPCSAGPGSGAPARAMRPDEPEEFSFLLNKMVPDYDR